MNKKSISSVELTAIVEELQFLVKGKFTQIYHQEKRELLLQLHASGKGKLLLKIIPGKYVCFTKTKQSQLRPTGFCMLLRKYIGNGFIRSIKQQGAERILVMEIERKETYYLIFELFSKGNIILTDKDYTVIGALDQNTWKNRTIRTRYPYVFPEVRVNWKKITPKQLKELLQKSEKKNLATALATEVGLGGLYAEEVCLKATVDKTVLPPEVSAVQVKSLIAAIDEIHKALKKPTGNIYENEITPFILEGKKPLKTVTSYTSALDLLKPFQVTSPYEKKIATIGRMIGRQEEALNNLQKKIDLNKQKGELIYGQYQPLSKLLSIVKTLREKKTWNDVGTELKKEKKITQVNLKKKSVTIEL
ncbi:hypothetical protein HOC32_01680 [Candidatus Woesearchaeota archaeon]|nr:hypothetical protein [Candidatus Woesearchaeota archaeon]